MTLDQKGLFNMCPGCIVDGDFLLPNEIDSWNFQHMLHFWFREASQNLSSFRQLFFHSFQGGDQRKNVEKPMYSFGNFSAFFLWSNFIHYDSLNPWGLEVIQIFKTGRSFWIIAVFFHLFFLRFFVPGQTHSCLIVYTYRTRAIITRGLYIFLPHFSVQFIIKRG